MAHTIVEAIAAVESCKNTEILRSREEIVHKVVLPADVLTFFSKYREVLFFETQVTLSCRDIDKQLVFGNRTCVRIAYGTSGDEYFIDCASDEIFFNVSIDDSDEPLSQVMFDSFAEFIIDLCNESNDPTPEEEDESCEAKPGMIGYAKTGVKTILNQLRRWFHPQKKDDDGCN